MEAADPALQRNVAEVGLVDTVGNYDAHGQIDPALSAEKQRATDNSRARRARPRARCN